MPPVTSDHKDEVIKAVVATDQRYGPKKLTARAVASESGASTTPTFRYLINIDNMVDAVISRTQDMLFEYTSWLYSERIVLNTGTGTYLCPRGHHRLCQALLSGGDGYDNVATEIPEVLE